MGIPLNESKKFVGFLVSWLLGFLASWFLGFKVSWFLGSKVSRIYQNIISCSQEDIDPSSKILKISFGGPSVFFDARFFRIFSKLRISESLKLIKICFNLF